MSHSSNHPGMRRPEKLALAPVQVEAHEQLAALLDSIRIEQHMSPDVPGPRPAMTDAMKERGSAPRGVRVVEDSGFPQPSLSVEEEEAPMGREYVGIDFHPRQSVVARAALPTLRIRSTRSDRVRTFGTCARRTGVWGQLQIG
jgi:hypothetical protein